MTSRVLISQAVSQFLANRRPPALANSTWGKLRARLLAFVKAVPVAYLDELTPLMVNAWLYRSGEGQSKSNVAAFRVFAQWCNDNMRAILEIPPAASTVAPRDYLLYSRGASVRRWQADAAAIGAQMAFPYQRAIFLLGYLFGWGLNKLSGATLADIADLPIRTELVDAVEAMQFLRPRVGPIFAPWLGNNHRSAQRCWKKWVGSKLPFTSVVNAGNAARMTAGIRPGGGSVRVETLIEALPLLDQDGVRRIVVPKLGR